MGPIAEILMSARLCLHVLRAPIASTPWGASVVLHVTPTATQVVWDQVPTNVIAASTLRMVPRACLSVQWTSLRTAIQNAKHATQSAKAVVQVHKTPIAWHVPTCDQLVEPASRRAITALSQIPECADRVVKGARPERTRRNLVRPKPTWSAFPVKQVFSARKVGRRCALLGLTNQSLVSPCASHVRQASSARAAPWRLTARPKQLTCKYVPRAPCPRPLAPIFVWPAPRL